MSLTTAVHESLPYIDTEPTIAERAAAQALIDAEMPSPSELIQHPSLPDLAKHHFSPTMEAEIMRIETKSGTVAGINLSHYEALDAPTSEKVGDWRDALSRAYTAERYLTGRLSNLSLLEEYGKNGWLVGNSQLEGILMGLEKELAERKTEIDVCVVERKNAQDAVSGEIKSLEEGWKKGVGRVLETEVAAEGLRREILERRRDGAS
jgi:pre-mRNA-splicing factor SPF27